MKIPRYWARATSEESQPFRVTAWGWSDESHGNALRHARERLVQIEERARREGELPKGYAYGRGPLREEILEEIHGSTGAIEALVTRNTLGCLVVNAEHALFMDIDVPPAGVGDLVRGFFGKRSDPILARFEQLKPILGSVPFASFRVYRTAGGLRVLATNPTFTPGSSNVDTLMQTAGVDPAYMQLCRIQQSFRARLTPKPWRCNVRHVPSQHPRDDPNDKSKFSTWLDEYNRTCATLATCRLLGTVGNGAVHEDVSPILRLHDDYTRAMTDLPLA